MNLQRLKDSPLLLDGFEEFVGKWLGDPSPEPIPLPDEDQATWLDALPPVVTRYWEMVHQWPGAFLGGSQDDFVGTSDWAQTRKIQSDEVHLVSENQGCWSIYWKIKEQELWISLEEESKLGLDLPSILVTFGMYSMAFGYWAEFEGESLWLDGEPVPEELLKSGMLIWSGVYSDPDHEFEFWYRADPQLIWFTYRSVTIFAARSGEDAEWLADILDLA